MNFGALIVPPLEELAALGHFPYCRAFIEFNKSVQ